MSAKPITVVGVDGAPLPAAALEALHQATLLIGSDHHTWALPNVVSIPRRPIGELDGVLEDLRNHDGPAVVLTAGDPGFFGIVRALRAGGLNPRVVPAPSAVQRLCAAIGRPWDDVAVVSAAEGGLRAAVNVCRARAAVAVLCAPEAGPAELAAALHGWQRTLVFAEDLGGPGERVSMIDAERVAGMRCGEAEIVLCLRDPAAVPPPSWYAGGEPTPPDDWGLPPSQFSHREGMLTAAEVRAVILAKLAPRPGVLVWDVGAGSGAVGVECARMGAAVLAVEQDPGQSIRIIANAAAHGVEVCVVEDSAPGAFAMLPDPDVIFVGGGGPRVVAACTRTGAQRIVVAFTKLDGFADCRDALRDNGFAVDGCQVVVSRFADAGAATRLAPTGPVLLLCGTRKQSV